MSEKTTEFLRPYQFEAVQKMSNGCILNGGVGSGKSRTGLYYYFKEQGGSMMKPRKKMKANCQDLYIITTAMKRDSKEWEDELSHYYISTDPELSTYKNKVVIDSWNNIKKYIGVKGAFFIFDEDRVTGKGAWVKAFYKIVKANNWIILSATPGDTWEQYIPVFIANGFYRSKREFELEHIVYSRFSKFPMIERYTNTGRLIRLRNKILIDMDFKRDTEAHHIDIWADYDRAMYKEAIKSRWDPYKDQPMKQASDLCYVLRRIVNADESRIDELLDIVKERERVIIFYNFDYELEAICNAFIEDEELSDYEIAEWNGHKHQEIPTFTYLDDNGEYVRTERNKWIYLVQYNAGCEGWNCITTNTIIFYSQNYSYKIVTQAAGRIDRMNTPFKHLYYYHLKSRSGIDLAISKALSEKKQFNENRWVNKKERKI